MNRLILRIYILLIILSILSVAGWIALSIQETRQDAITGSEQNFDNMSAAIAELWQIGEQEEAPPTVEPFLNTPDSGTTPVAVAVTTLDHDTDYLWARRDRYLEGMVIPGSTPRPTTTLPTYSYLRVSRSFQMPDNSHRVITAVYPILSREQAYPVLQRGLIAALIVAAAALALAVVLVLVNHHHQNTTALATPDDSDSKSDSKTDSSEHQEPKTPEPKAQEPRTPESKTQENDEAKRELSSRTPRTPIFERSIEILKKTEPDVRSDDKRQETPVAEAPQRESTQPAELYPEIFAADEAALAATTSWEETSREQVAIDQIGMELDRAAFMEHDLAVIAVEFSGYRNMHGFREQRERIMDTVFPNRELRFLLDDDKILIILPDTSIQGAIQQTEEFQKAFRKGFPPAETENDAPDFCAGLTARAFRLVDSQRILKECYISLEQARTSQGRIVGFQPNPQRYRAFLSEG